MITVQINGFNTLNASQNDWALFYAIRNIVNSSSGSGSLITTVTVSQNISAYQIVTSDGYIADTSIVGKRNWTLGISTSAISSGFSGDIVLSGIVTNSSWTWTVGSPIFLNGTSISQTCPSTGFAQILGVATKTDTIDLNIHQATLL